MDKFILNDDCIYAISEFLETNTDMLHYILTCKYFYELFKQKKGFLRFLIYNEKTDFYGLNESCFYEQFYKHEKSLRFLTFRKLSNPFRFLPTTSSLPPIILFENCQFTTSTLFFHNQKYEKIQIIIFYHCFFYLKNIAKWKWKKYFPNLKKIICNFSSNEYLREIYKENFENKTKLQVLMNIKEDDKILVKTTFNKGNQINDYYSGFRSLLKDNCDINNNFEDIFSLLQI